MLRRLLRILGRRTLATFGLVTFLVSALLATVNITSRYALKRYVDDQLSRIPWDIADYQQGAVGNDRGLHDYIAAAPGVAKVENLAFLRARFPEGGEVDASVDGRPFTTPWLCVLAASDPSILPPELGYALAASKAAGDIGVGDRDAGHIQMAEYAPKVVHLARLDRAAIISGWDLEGSLDRVEALTARLHTTAPQIVKPPEEVRDPSEGGAQLGTDWQVLYNAPDMVDVERLRGPASQQLAALRPEVEKTLESIKKVAGVRDATYMVHAVLPTFYLPG